MCDSGVCLCVLQKLKEFLEGRNLITKLQAKHDLIQKTLGESEWDCRSVLHTFQTSSFYPVCLSVCAPSCAFVC